MVAIWGAIHESIQVPERTGPTAGTAGTPPGSSPCSPVSRTRTRGCGWLGKEIRWGTRS